MTLAPHHTEPDSAPDDEHDLSRITVNVGDLLIDVGLPTRVSISAIVNDVIALANEQVSVRTGRAGAFDNTEGKWTFARPAGTAIDPDRSLAEAGIYDGELLVVREADAAMSSLLIDDVEGMAEPVARRDVWFTDHRWPAAWFVLSITLSIAAALLIPLLANAPSVVGVRIDVLMVLVLGGGCAVGALAMPRLGSDVHKSAWLAGVGLPLIFGGSLFIVPDGHGVKALPMALALAGLFALLQLLIVGQGRPLYTAVFTLAALGIPAAVAQLLWTPNPRTVGAILGTVAVIVVYLAPKATIVLSKLPVPRVPTAGEPLDDIETQGGTAVEGVDAVGKQIIPTEEGMTDRVRRARERLTGIIAAAALLAIVGAYFALDVSNGFFWQGTAFAVVVATVLCLRGRSHHDLVQSSVLIGGGLLITVAAIVKTAVFVDGWQVNAALALCVLTVLLVVCGLVAPMLEFSPIMRRWVEIIEYFAIALVFPLACWIIGVYAYVRELRT